ncbi:MAG: hypothetical protein J6X78_11245, partial [Treponema sp.]|nr:hypothetical protein [Treponema sp.]
EYSIFQMNLLLLEILRMQNRHFSPNNLCFWNNLMRKEPFCHGKAPFYMKFSSFRDEFASFHIEFKSLSSFAPCTKAR